MLLFDRLVREGKLDDKLSQTNCMYCRSIRHYTAIRCVLDNNH